jgi:hypothetical protein
MTSFGFHEFKVIVSMRKRKTAKAVPYPAPRSERSQRLMLGVLQGLGSLPSNDDEIEDRVLACLLVAWGEVAAMQDGRRRDDIVNSLGDLSKRVVGKLVAVGGEVGARAKSRGQSLVGLLYDALDEGTAEEMALPKSRSRH